MGKEFESRVAIVTGGSRGIGRAVSLRLAQEGSDVALSYATRSKDAEETVAAIDELGRRAIAVPCDVSKPDDVNALVAKTRSELGPIGFLVHCGAVCTLADHNALDYDTWQETINVNLTGAYLTIFAVKNEMLERQFGRIVTISSIAGLLPRPQMMHYSASKAGVMALTRCCSEAFAPHVRINSIAPGMIETEMLRGLSDERIAELAALTPLERIGEPEEIAALARFLLSDESSYTTGQTIIASGGRCIMT